MLFTSGCFARIEPYTRPTVDDDTSPSSTPLSSDPHPEPVKYSFDAFGTCEEIQQRIPELLPPLESQRGDDSYSSRFSQQCTFTTSQDDSGSFITFRVELYENREDAYGFQSGSERAKTGFSVSVSPDDEKDGTVGIGSEAQWDSPQSGVDGCDLEVLDENAVLITSYYPRIIGDTDPRSEECREGARDIARKFYAAVQP